MRKLYVAILPFALISCPLSSAGQSGMYNPGQPSPNSSYVHQAAQVRSEVWSWDIPAFSDYTVPEEYADESAVVLARHRQIDVTGKKSNAAKIFFLGNAAGKLFYTDTDRRLIRINDQAALDNFSEYSFREKTNYGYALSNSNSLLTVMGVRIIKPDGAIIEVDVSEASVSMTEGKSDKEAYRKLAIPELQKGDILDIFTCEIYELEFFNIPVQTVQFYSADYPAKAHSCALVFGKNLTIEYRSVNGAPLFARQTDGEGNTVLKAETDDVKRVNDLETLRWLSSLRDLPVIRFVVLQNASKVFFKPKSARELGVHENVPYERILEDARWYLATYQSALPMLRPVRKKVSETVAKYKAMHPELSPGELADLIYASLNFEWGSQSSGSFVLLFNELLKEHHIDCKVGFTTNKYNARKDEVVTAGDVQYVVTANDDSQFFFAPYRYRVPGEIPPVFQGETATVSALNSIYILGGTPSRIDAGPETTLIIPESTSADNVNSTRIEASLLPDDIQKMRIDRHSVWTGALKDDIQPWLLLYEDWDTTMRGYLHIDKNLMDELGEKRSTRKLTDRIAGDFEKDRDEYDETMKREVFAYHFTEPHKIENYSFTNFGVTNAKPNLEYDVEYVMDGFVRMAGENLIVDAGKLIGIQWNPTDNERNRNTDAYITSARVFENEISIDIPEGYAVGETAHLNVNHANEYISFEAEAEVDGGKVVIKARKCYRKAFIPVVDWGKLMEIIDRTNDFYSSSIVFKRESPSQR